MRPHCIGDIYPLDVVYFHPTGSCFGFFFSCGGVFETGGISRSVVHPKQLGGVGDGVVPFFKGEFDDLCVVPPVGERLVLVLRTEEVDFRESAVHPPRYVL